MTTPEKEMRRALLEAERRLPALLLEPEIWDSKFIDYEKPFVERLFTSVGGYRICLHRILPCKPEQAFFHPHPWPSAVRLLEGRYRMEMAYGEGIRPPRVMSSVTLGPGDDYIMTHRDCWHSVSPIDGAAHSLMVMGPEWIRPMPKTPRKTLEKLSPQVMKDLLDQFQVYYPLRPTG